MDGDLDLRLPASKNRLSALGRRLAAGQTIPGDHELYAELLDVYDRAQRTARSLLEKADWSVVDLAQVSLTGRPKTLDTLVQKLRRSPATQLPYIRDIAGVRLVADMTLFQQDLVSRGIAGIFDVPPENIIDRTESPASGYRARHVVVRIGQIPVEIQVRTRLQHLWAEVFERLADQYGRQIRYGEPPDEGTPASWDGPAWSRREVVDGMIRLSLDQIATVEAAASQLRLIRAAVAEDNLIGRGVRDQTGIELDHRRLQETQELHELIRSSEKELEESLDQLMRAVVDEARRTP